MRAGGPRSQNSGWLSRDVAALAGGGVEIDRDQLAALGVDEALVGPLPVGAGRPSRQRLVAPALDQEPDQEDHRPDAEHARRREAAQGSQPERAGGEETADGPGDRPQSYP